SSRAAWTVIDRCLSVSTAPDDVALCLQAVGDGRVDWLAVAWLANRHFAAPALWTMFARPEFDGRIPEGVRTYLALLHARNAERNERIRHQCLEIGTTLTRAGLRAVLLKGVTWLFDGSTAAAGDRMMRDIDLLVAADHVDDAVRALTAAGYND